MSASIEDRNNMIRQTLEDDRTPVLRFELEIIDRDMRSHVDAQQKLGAIMGEAMTQSSETWHDNAPAEAIANESKILSERADRVAKLIGSRALFDYVAPDAAGDGITLGSIVDVEYVNDNEVERIVITGVSRQLTPEVEQISTCGSENCEVEAVTISSPLGSALLGRESGDVVEFKGPNGRIIELRVVLVRQLNL